MKIRILFAVTLLCLLTVHTGTAAAAEGGGTALFFEDPAFPADERTVRCLKELLTLEGYAIMPVNAEALCSTAELTAAHNTLLVLADAARLPMAAIPPVTAYLNQGGNLLALMRLCGRSGLPVLGMSGSAWKHTGGVWQVRHRLTVFLISVRNRSHPGTAVPTAWRPIHAFLLLSPMSWAKVKKRCLSICPIWKAGTPPAVLSKHRLIRRDMS